MWFKKLLVGAMPKDSFYADHLSLKGRRFVKKFAIGVVGVVVAAVGLGLSASFNAVTAIGGFLLGVSVSVVTWAYKSNSSEYADVEAEVQSMAELELLHGRLNAISAKLGLDTIELSRQLYDTLAIRKERIAHYSGLDEYRPDISEHQDGWRFWGSPNVDGRLYTDDTESGKTENG